MGVHSFTINLPKAPDPVGAYERGVIRNGVGFVSGQLPLVDGRLIDEGRIGVELTEAQGRASAKVAALNCLAQIEALLTGDWDCFLGLYRVDGYVASADDYTRQATVLDAASEVFVEVLGQAGRHARAALGVTSLPLNAPVELAVSFATRIT